jgi:preprotein translocase subunit YajC
MFVTDAFAQAPGAAGGDSTAYLISQIGMIALIVLVFYFLLIRPQQRRLKAHQDMIKNLQRGDTIVTSGGLIGKIKSLADDEVRVELSPNVEVRVVRGTIADVRNKGAPAPANDTKPAKTE